MTDTQEQPGCSNPDCRIRETGACVDGHEDLTACPFHGQELSEIETDARVEKIETSTPIVSREMEYLPSLVKISRAEAFNLRETATLLSARPAAVVSIVGPVGAGKTSLIASAYDLFQTGRLGDLCFAESRTLLGFEKISHPARASSEAPEVVMERTDNDPDPFFYHLCLRHRGSLRDVLIADRSGELYERVSDQPSYARDLIELTQAWTITVLIDGGAMCQPLRRHEILAEARQFLSSIMHAEALSPSARLIFVLTKTDLVDSSDNAAHLRAAFKALVTDVETKHGNDLGQVSAMEIAASPQIKGVERGLGVEALLRAWLEAPERKERAKLRPPVRPCRAMGRYGHEGDAHA